MFWRGDIFGYNSFDGIASFTTYNGDLSSFELIMLSLLIMKVTIAGENFMPEYETSNR
jgi:hypothetical protein